MILLTHGNQPAHADRDDRRRDRPVRRDESHRHDGHRRPGRPAASGGHVVRRARRRDLGRDQAQVPEGGQHQAQPQGELPHRGRHDLRQPARGVLRGSRRDPRRPGHHLQGGGQRVGALQRSLHRRPQARGRHDDEQARRGAHRLTPGALVGSQQARAAGHAGGGIDSAAGNPVNPTHPVPPSLPPRRERASSGLSESIGRYRQTEKSVPPMGFEPTLPP